MIRLLVEPGGREGSGGKVSQKGEKVHNLLDPLPSPGIEKKYELKTLRTSRNQFKTDLFFVHLGRN